MSLFTPPPTRRTVDLYFSADVETDGPIPRPYSMLSFGIAVAGSFDGQTFRRPEKRETFYRELQPISESWDAKALEVSGLDRARLLAGDTIRRARCEKRPLGLPPSPRAPSPCSWRIRSALIGPGSIGTSSTSPSTRPSVIRAAWTSRPFTPRRHAPASPEGA